MKVVLSFFLQTICKLLAMIFAVQGLLKVFAIFTGKQ